MFPARAGMSPARYRPVCVIHDVPRASGDEPMARASSAALIVCSPRERG